MEEKSNSVGSSEGIPRGFKIALVFIIVLLVLGAVVAGFLFLSPSEPEIEVREITLVTVEWEQSGLLLAPVLHIQLSIEITNGNAVGASVSHVTGKIYLDDTEPEEEDHIGDYKIKDAFDVPPKGSVVVPMDVHIRDIPSPATATEVIKDDSAYLRVVGTVHISFPIRDFTVDFDSTEKVSGFL